MRALVCSILVLLAPSVAAAQRTAIARPSGSTLTLVTPGGPPPSNVRAGATPTSITIKWTCPSGATGYEVFATPVGGTGQQVKLTANPIPPQCVQEFLPQPALPPDPRLGGTQQTTYGSGFTHTGLVPGMQFVYVVRALYPEGVGDAPPLTAQSAPWPPPSAVTPTLTGRSVRLTWNPVPGATGYLVLRQLAGESALTQLTPTPLVATSYSDATILAPGDHRYSVQAVDGSPATAVTVHVGNWPAPTFTQAVMGYHRRITMNWNAIPGAPAYAVYRNSAGQGFQQVATRPSTEAWYVEEDLPVGPHTFYVQVVGAGDPSTQVTVVSGKPRASARIYRGQPTVDLGWMGTDLALDVRILRSPAIGGPYVDISHTPKSESRPGFFRYRNATVGATEYYKILALYPNPVGLLESDPVTVTIPPGPVGPTNLQAQSPAQTNQFVSKGQASVWITWTCDPEATSYSVMRGPAGHGGLEWIKDSRGFPLKIVGCACLDIFWPGNIAAYDYKIVGNYPDQDTSSEAMITVQARGP